MYHLGVTVIIVDQQEDIAMNSPPSPSQLQSPCIEIPE